MPGILHSSKESIFTLMSMWMGSPGLVKCTTCRAVSRDLGQKNWFRAKKGPKQNSDWLQGVLIHTNDILSFRKVKETTILTACYLSTSLMWLWWAEGILVKSKAQKFSFIWSVFDSNHQVLDTWWELAFLWDIVVISIWDC